MLNRLFQFIASFFLVWSVFANGAMADTLPLKTVTFAAYGDIPYMVKLPDGRTDEQVLIQDLAPKMRQDESIPFVIHLGDLGRPQDACSDAWLEKTKTFWQNEVVKPVFYTPGDNDWTDCDRKNLVNRQSELARLDALRKILFSEPKTLSPEWRYERQEGFPENETWWYNGVLFVTTHVVSTDNGRTEILLDDPEKAIELVELRDAANVAWLDRAFEKAKDSDTAAVVVATQLDPFGPAIADETPVARCLNNPAYKEFCVHLQAFASRLDKPVLLVHGDTNAYCFDQPFAVAEAPKLWRLNAAGDYKYIDGTLISFDPDSSDQPFKVTGLLSGNAPPQVCDYSY